MLGEEVSNSHFILFSMCVCFLNYSLREKNQVTIEYYFLKIYVV
jgi:hypothetical protein